MDYCRLGKTCLYVSKLCFGTLPMGPLQKNLPLDTGALLIYKALESGINFFDTAEMYGTYMYLKKGIELFRERNKDLVHDIVIATKSVAATYEEMQHDIEKAINELQENEISIFLMHSSNEIDDEVFRQRAGALKCLIDYKTEGVIKAIGISTHNSSAVIEAANRDEIDVVFPLINIKGMGLVNCCLENMISAIDYAHSKSKGLYAMKIYAGGNLLKIRKEALEYVMKNESIDSIAIGMLSEDELDVNMKLLSNTYISEDLWNRTGSMSKKLIIMNWCEKCGSCVKRCASGALKMEDKRVKVDESLCVLCGYCAKECPVMAIRLI